MFEALDKVLYDSLQLDSTKPKTTPKKRKVKPLVDLSCIALNWHSPLLDEGTSILPVHLVPKLLKIAVANNQTWAMCTLIANWPMETLRILSDTLIYGTTQANRVEFDETAPTGAVSSGSTLFANTSNPVTMRFADILSQEEAQLFKEDMGVVCLYTFEGMTSRTKHCKLKCLDFREINLNASFYKLIIQTWPFLSMTKAQLKPKKLAQTIAQAAGVDKMKLSDEVIPKILEERLGQDILKSSDNRIKIPKGQRLEVKIDSVHFSTNSLFFMDYMICNCLRTITPIYITVSNIYIKSQLLDGDLISDSLAPFLVLKGQNSESLEGLSLRQLEEGVFFIISGDIQKYKHLHSLDMQDCNIYLQEGITRSRTFQRTRLIDTFGSFTHLHRLDIGFNYLIGCLGELLDALQHPLDFLSLRGCDLNETDLTHLAKSKHAKHLRELNLSKLCQFSIYESDRISPTYLLKLVKHFTNLSVLNLSQNHLPDSGIPEFCETLATHLSQLKALDIAGNILQFDNQLDIVRACAKVKSMQWIRFTCVNNMMNNGLLLENNQHQIGEMLLRFKDLLKSLGRDDVIVDVVRLSFAILVDLIDIFD